MVLPLAALGPVAGTAAASGAASVGKIASVLGGAGSFLSGIGAIGGLFGGKKSRPDPVAEQIRLDHQQLTKKFKWAVEGAQKAGLHPLFALGGQLSNTSPVAITSGDPSRNASQRMVEAGQVLGRLSKSGVDREEVRRQEIHEADLMESFSRRALNEANADAVYASLLASKVGRVTADSNSNQDTFALSQLRDPGRKQGTHQLNEDTWGGVISEFDSVLDYFAKASKPEIKRIKSDLAKIRRLTKKKQNMRSVEEMSGVPEWAKRHRKKGSPVFELRKRRGWRIP